MRRVLACACIVTVALITTIGPAESVAVTPGAQYPQAEVDHASDELLRLAAEFRAFRSPVFRPRTWRPTHRVEAVPDYAAIVAEQQRGLPEFQERLAAIDPRAWPVHDQVDWLLLRSEMDDVQFEHAVLREIHVNPSFYIEQAINRMSATMGATVPYGEEVAESIITAFEQMRPILEQGPQNLVLDEAAAELGEAALMHMEDMRSEFEAGVELLRPHFPEAHRERLAAAADDAAGAVEEYAEWVGAHLQEMHGDPHVGRDDLEWFLKRVNYVPWGIDELLYLGEIEKNRFLMSIEVEEHENRGLPELDMPTTEEWIEWFRLTYLQTKYWLDDMELISFPPYVGESYLVEGSWQEPFGGLGNRPGLMHFPSEPKPEPSKRLAVVPEDHWFTQTYWERTMRLDPITDYQHSDWPGHYFEAQVTQRNPCPIRAVHRDTGFSQGWAHYWEELFLDMGYPYLRGPRTRELTYNFLLLRAVRVPLDLYLSFGDLSMEEAIQYQIDRVPTMEPHISRAEVELYVRWPYQATSYIVGKKQIEQILGDRIMQEDFSVDWRRFHDTMLASGQIPLALVRWEMTGLDDQIQQLWDAAAYSGSASTGAERRSGS